MRFGSIWRFFPLFLFFSTGISFADIIPSKNVGQDVSIKVSIGKFQSRALWNPILGGGKLTPAIVLLPGSGPHGPEEMMPSYLTGDGQDHALFNEIAKPFNQVEISTLQLGKPGIEFFTSWDEDKKFYDKNLYDNLHWQDLIDNLAAAVLWLRLQPNVDPNKIYVLGHSEGTQVAVDFAKSDSQLAGVILLGYSGEDMATILDWQIFKRDIEDFLSPDVDFNHDGFISKEEASSWPEFHWDWKAGEEMVSFARIEQMLRNDPDIISFFNHLKDSPLYFDGVYNRGPLYNETASLKQDVYVFTGALDEQTPAKNSLKLAETCEKAGKKDCFVTIVPGLGHGFSPPRAPRGHPLLDMTLGPVDSGFLATLGELGKRL